MGVERHAWKAQLIWKCYEISFLLCWVSDELEVLSDISEDANLGNELGNFQGWKSIFRVWNSKNSQVQVSQSNFKLLASNPVQHFEMTKKLANNSLTFQQPKTHIQNGFNEKITHTTAAHTADVRVSRVFIKY